MPPPIEMALKLAIDDHDDGSVPAPAGVLLLTCLQEGSVANALMHMLCICLVCLKGGTHLITCLLQA